MRAGWRGVGGIYFRRAIEQKETGAPAGRRPVGRRTHFEGMKATIDLVALYLELGWGASAPSAPGGGKKSPLNGVLPCHKAESLI